MNFKLFLCIAAGVGVAHLAIFMMIWRIQLMRNPPKPIPQPTFSHAQETFVNKTTGEKTVVREFTISTKIAPQPADATPPK